MLTTILSILGIVVPIITKTGVLGTTASNLLSSLSAPITTLLASLFSGGQTKTQDFLAALAALSGVVAVLKSTPGMSPDALTEINNVDLDIQAALKAYATAGTGFDPNVYAPVPPVV